QRRALAVGDTNGWSLLASTEHTEAIADSSVETSIEHTPIRKLQFRLIPYLFLLYVVAMIDRVNISFAQLTMNKDLGLSSQQYGIAAGIFFIGYFIFEIPSNLILHRVGARIWIARIMIVWGLVSMAFMFLKGATMFYVMRFLLGAAEAGFFPGVLLYFTYWYPSRERAKIIALFAIGGVAAGVIGSPISGTLLSMDGIAGLKGWQWLFILEGIPSVLLGFVILA